MRWPVWTGLNVPEKKAVFIGCMFYLSFIEKLSYWTVCLFLGFFQNIVHYDFIEFWCERQFVFSFRYPMSYNFRGICRSVFQSLFQRLYAGWLDKQSESLVSVIFFYVESADNVDIENNIFPRVENPFHFAFQSAVELPGIDFFIFQKFVVRYTFAKFIGCDEIIFDAVFLSPSRSTTGGGDREWQVQIAIQ